GRRGTTDADRAALEPNSSSNAGPKSLELSRGRDSSGSPSATFRGRLAHLGRIWVWNWWRSPVVGSTRRSSPWGGRPRPARPRSQAGGLGRGRGGPPPSGLAL